MAKELKVSILLQSIADSKGFASFNAEMGKTKNAIKEMAPALTAISAGFAAVTGAAAATGAFVYKSIQFASGLKDMSEQANISTDALQTLGYVAAQNGADMETMTKAMAKAQTKAADAVAGNEEAAKSFARLGISAAKFAKLSPEAQLERLGRAAMAASGDAEALAAVMNIVGEKNAPRLMASLRDLADKGFAHMSDEAKKAGNVLSKEAIDAMDKAGDRIQILGTKLKVASAELVNWSVDNSAIKATADSISEFLSTSGRLNSMEQRFGNQSVITNRARLEYVETLIKEGKTKAALIEFNRTLKQADDIIGQNGPKYVELRGRVARELAAAQKDTSKAITEGMDKAEAVEVQAAERRKAANADETARAKERIALAKTAAEEEAAAIKKQTEAVKSYEAAVRAVENRGVNEFAKRGLQLGAAQNLGPAPTMRGMPPPVVMPEIQQNILTPNNAGREDARVPSLLNSIDATLKLISGRQLALT